MSLAAQLVNWLSVDEQAIFVERVRRKKKKLRTRALLCQLFFSLDESF